MEDNNQKLDKSILDRVLHRDTEVTEPAKFQLGHCPNCANNGKTSKLSEEFSCDCGYVTPLNDRPSAISTTNSGETK